MLAVRSDDDEVDTSPGECCDWWPGRSVNIISLGHSTNDFVPSSIKLFMATLFQIKSFRKVNLLCICEAEEKGKAKLTKLN